MRPLEQLAVLESMGRMLASSKFDLPTLLKEIACATTKYMKAEACLIRLLDIETEEVLLEAAHGHNMTLVSDVSFKEDIWKRVRQGGAIEILDVDKYGDTFPSGLSQKEPVGKMLIGGMFKKGRVFGLLGVLVEEGYEFSELEKSALRVLAAHAALAVELSQLHEENLENERLNHELLLASDVQARMLPAQMPSLPGVHIAAWNQPWHEVGGDFYDFIELPGSGFGLAIGDVSGKGFGAGLLMATVRSALRSQAENLYWLPEIFRRINTLVYQSSKPEQFSTLFYGAYDASAKTLSYINAGHDPPFVIRGQKTIRLETGGIPVGLFPAAHYESAMVQLRKGDLLVCYTDGFTDAVNSEGRVFGEKRLIRALHEYKNQSPEIIIESVNTELVKAGCGGDDRTMTVLKLIS